jgi:hypothetical protein
MDTTRTGDEKLSSAHASTVIHMDDPAFVAPAVIAGPSGQQQTEMPSPSVSKAVTRLHGMILATIFVIAGFIVAALYGITVATFYPAHDYYRSHSSVDSAMLVVLRSAYYVGYLMGSPLALLWLHPISAVLGGCVLTTVAAFARVIASLPGVSDSVLVSYACLVLGLFCTGLGYSFLTAYMMSIIEPLVPYRRRAFALGAVTTAGYLGFFVFNAWTTDTVQTPEQFRTNGYLVVLPCAIVIAIDLAGLGAILSSKERYCALCELFDQRDAHLRPEHRRLPPTTTVVQTPHQSAADGSVSLVKRGVQKTVRDQLQRLRVHLGVDPTNQVVVVAYLIGYGFACALSEITGNYLIFFCQLKQISGSDILLLSMLYLVPGNVMPLVTGWIIDRRHNWKVMIWVTIMQQACSAMLFLYVDWGILAQFAMVWHSLSVTYESLFATYFSELVYPARADTVVNIMWWMDVFGSGLSTIPAIASWSFDDVLFYIGCFYAALAVYFSLISFVCDPILYRFVDPD